jgi:hypothetical protein
MITTEAKINKERDPNLPPVYLALTGETTFEISPVKINESNFMAFKTISFDINTDVLQDVRAANLTKELKSRLLEDFKVFLDNNIK